MCNNRTVVEIVTRPLHELPQMSGKRDCVISLCLAHALKQAVLVETTRSGFFFPPRNKRAVSHIQHKISEKYLHMESRPYPKKWATSLLILHNCAECSSRYTNVPDVGLSRKTESKLPASKPCWAILTFSLRCSSSATQNPLPTLRLNNVHCFLYLGLVFRTSNPRRIFPLRVGME